MEYSFCMVEAGDPPRDYLFTFTVLYGTDEQTIHIEDCSMRAV